MNSIHLTARGYVLEYKGQRFYSRDRYSLARFRKSLYVSEKEALRVPWNTRVN